MSSLRFVCISVAAIFMVGVFSGVSSAGTPKEEPKESVEIFSYLSSPSVCVGTEHLKVRIVVTNSGGIPVNLDISRLSTTVGFVALFDITEMKFRHESFSSIYDPIGQTPQPQITALSPKGFFEKDIEVPINSPFFSRAGFYKLNLSSSVRVNRLSQSSDLFSSDSAIFELRACESK